MTTYYASSGVCSACSLVLPANSAYDPSQMGNIYTDSCNFVCNTGYVKNSAGTACVTSSCTAPTDTHAMVTTGGSTCVYQCNAGYISLSSQTSTSVCAACPAGTYSTSGNTACTSCATNYYASSTASSTCLSCAALLPTTYGQYLSGCGGTSIGSVQQCSNSS